MPSELGIEIYVPSARPMSAFRPERTVLFVHGAAYPAHTSFDLKLDGMSWMDARLRRLSPRPSRLTAAPAVRKRWTRRPRANPPMVRGTAASPRMSSASV